MVDNNNGSFDDTTEEFFDDTDFPPLKSPRTPSAVDLSPFTARIADLENDKSHSESRIAELTSELAKIRIEKDAELAKLKAEKDVVSEEANSNHKAAETIAKRAAELEAQVARLQHDFITASDAEKLESEVADLKKEKAMAEEKLIAMELQIAKLLKKSQESDQLIDGLMEKIADYETEAKADQLWNGFKENLPVIGAVSVGVILIGGVLCYVRHCRN